MEIFLIVTLAVMAMLVVYVIGIFNNLVSKRNRYKNAFAQIEVQLKRRYDLIPNLIETAKGYMKHENETLQAVIVARNAAANGLAVAASNPSNAGAINELSGAEGALAGAMGKFNVVMEAYPDLKANQNMLQLSEELISTENKISFARQAFNDQVMEYNTYKQSFPPILFVNMFDHIQDASLLRFEDSAEMQVAPKASY